MIIQRVVVWIYSCCVFLQTRVPHKRWIALVAGAIYIAWRATGRPHGTKAGRGIHINLMDSTTKYDPAFLPATPVRALWTDDSFECVGWQRLKSCGGIDHDGTMELDMLSCTDLIGPEMAGYCLIRNRTSGDLVKTMVTTCDSVATGQYSCDMARNFTEYAVHAQGYTHTPLAPSLAMSSFAATKSHPTNGIVMIVYGKVLASAYATIRVLRLHGCELPVELWYRPDEMTIENAIINKLLLEFNVRIRPIFDSRAKGFHVKPYAVYYSNFDNVLLLDADNIPTKDPSYLFEDPEFLRTGAIFWPDYWQPANSLFELTNTSLLWQLTGVTFVDQFEQESGQVLIDRRRARKALDKLMFYSTHQPRLMEELHLLWGDKDLFRLAWRNTSQPFHYIQFPPAVGGLDLKEKGLFCGLSMLQRDVQGNLLFFHRNSIKLDGTPDQPRIMTHIQEYSLLGDPKDYRIFQAVYAHKECCYYIGTEWLPDGQPATKITSVGTTVYGSLEELAIQFSIEGQELLIAEENVKKHIAVGDSPTPPLRIQEVVVASLVAYVMLIILLVLYRARPARERLPSRWKADDEKQR